MGNMMKEDDTYIPSMVELLNLRFAPGTERGVTSGLGEMVILQKEFQIFQVNRSFRDSAAILNLGGLWNPRVRTRWYALLDWIGRQGSNISGKNGNQAIVEVLIANLASRSPKPVYFTAHPQADDNKVLITPSSRPLFYILVDYITISFPMRPKGIPTVRRRS
jgi:hypothetical protein